jgi:N-acyl-D-amino-acid deacylase
VTAVRTTCLVLTLAALTAPARAADDAVRAAVEKGLSRLETGAASYVQNRQCFSCHHQTPAIVAFQSARKRGFTVSGDALQAQVDFTAETFRPKREQIAKGQWVPGGNTHAAYALYTLEVGGYAPDETTAALVEYLLVRQKPDGSWPAVANRPPMEGSAFTNAALALRALKYYGPGKEAADADDLRKRVEAASDKGRDWLLHAKPATTEDEASRLRGLAWAGADAHEVAAARDLLLTEQRDDGGWAQLPDRDSDAYATGIVLTALRAAGVRPEDEAYRKGVEYLLKTQTDDGAWIVQTRSRPVQTFFDNGDPGGKSQFISFAATGWAVQALLETRPEK